MTHPQQYSRKELRSIIFGTLLGDSWLSARGQFQCEQTALELINYKRNILEQLTNRKLNISERQRENQIIEGRLVKGQRTFKVTINHPHYKKYYKVLYKNGRKQITNSLLRRLTPEAIAMWFMDDGYIDYKKSNNTRYLRICTDSFSEHEHRLIISWLKNTFNIDAFIYWHQNKKNAIKKPRISMNGKNAQKFIGLIYQYILPCFYYKIDLHYSRMDSININPNYRVAIEFISQNRAANTIC